MTQEEILEAMAILIRNNKDASVAAQMIYDLYAIHPEYAVVAGKIINRKTGLEFGK
jgi:hypothetical protein